MWAVLSAILPWSTFGLIAALFYFVARSRRAERLAGDRELQLRDLSARVSALKAENMSQRDQLALIRIEASKAEERVRDAQIRAGRIQAAASEVARQMKLAKAGGTDENFKRLMGLLYPDGWL